jgi:hypothetical protein
LFLYRVFHRSLAFEWLFIQLNGHSFNDRAIHQSRQVRN